MPLVTYATEDDLTTGDPAWVSPAPANAGSLLRAATIAVARACNLNPYQAPDLSAVDALKDATCAQVASWVALGVDPAKSGTDLPGPIRQSTINGASVARDTTATSKLLEAALTELCQLAHDILLQAGLLYVPVPLGPDQPDPLPSWGTGAPPIQLSWVDPLSGEYDWPTIDGELWPTY